MQKLLYAINHEKTETAITKKLDPNKFVIVGTVPHREALQKTLESSGANIVLYRESLKGSTETFELMKTIRTEFPDVRIVFIANEQSAASQLLAKLVFLGIYDVINTDKMYLGDIIDFIVHPKNFGYAEKFFRTEYLASMLPDVPDQPATAGSKKKGRIFDVIMSMRPTAPQEDGAPIASTSSATDFELMRSAMLEEARRVAQAELPQLVEMQTKETHAALTKELEKKDKTIAKLQQAVSEKEQNEQTLKRQTFKMEQQREAIASEMARYKSETEKTIVYYQDQLRSLQTTHAPKWYQDQMSAWQAERGNYIEKIDQLTIEVQTLSQLSNIEDSKQELVKVLAQVSELQAENTQYLSEISKLKGELAAMADLNDIPMPDVEPSESNNSALIAARAQIMMLSNELSALRSGQPADAEELQRNLAEATNKIARLEASLASTKKNLSESQDIIMLMSKDMEAIRSQSEHPEQSADGETVEVLRLELAQVRAELAVAKTNVSNNEESEALRKELEQMKLELAASKKQNINEDVEALRLELNQTKAELALAKTQTGSDEEAETLRLELAQTRAELALVKAQVPDEEDTAVTQAELDRLKTNLAQANSKIEELEGLLSMQSQVTAPHEPEMGEGTTSKFTPNITSRYKVGAGDGRMIAFVGAKPGVGNTTVALNTAVSLAEQGHKTLLVEVDCDYPVIPSLFEFENRAVGLDTVMAALTANNLSIAAQDIVKPHVLAATKKEMGKVYKALPPSLHFLNYSNKATQKNSFTAEDFKTLSYFLLTQEQYSYVIFDVQGNDFSVLQAMLSGNCRVHQLFVTTTQDPHSASAAKKLITKLKNTCHPALVANAYCIVNQFAAQNKMTIKKMADYLSINEDFIHKLSFDSAGYLNANFAAIPYRLTKEKFAKEYDTVRKLLVS